MAKNKGYKSDDSMTPSRPLTKGHSFPAPSFFPRFTHSPQILRLGWQQQFRLMNRLLPVPLW